MVYAEHRFKKDGILKIFVFEHSIVRKIDKKGIDSASTFII